MRVKHIERVWTSDASFVYLSYISHTSLMLCYALQSVLLAELRVGFCAMTHCQLVQAKPLGT